MGRLACVLAAFLLTISSADLRAQSPDPISDSLRVIANGGRDEIISRSFNGITIFKYFRAGEFAPHDTIVQALGYQTTGGLGSYLSPADLVTGNFDRDMLPEIASVLWLNWTDTVSIMLLKPEAASLSRPGIARWARLKQVTQTIPVPYHQGAHGRSAILRIVAGNFDADSLDEVVVATWADQGAAAPRVHLTLYDVGDSLTLTRKGSLTDIPVPVPPRELHAAEYYYFGDYFDIAAADLNGDGQAEIVLAARVPLAPTGRAVIARVYTYNAAASQFAARGTDTVFASRDTLYEVHSINITAGRLASVQHDDAFVTFHVLSPVNAIDTLAFHLATLGAASSLDSLTIYQEFCPYRNVLDSRDLTIIPPSLRDIDGDGLLEVSTPLAIGAFDRVYDIGPDHRCTPVAAFDPALAGQVWQLGDFRADSTTAEAFVIEPFASVGYPARVYPLVPGAGGYQLGAMKASGYVPNAAACADLDGDLRLGSPRSFRITQIVQPLVILNTPPIHFDVFDGTSYDVSKSYNRPDGQFIAGYSKQSSTAREVDVEINADWGYSWESHIGGSFWGVSAEAHFSETVGKKFSKRSQMTTKVTVSLAAEVKEDDKIYAAVMDVDVWEYPVLWNGQRAGDFLVVYPKPVENRWFPSKSWSGYSYVPTHEVGNILSYREYANLSQNPAVAERIKGDFSHSFSLDANASYNWSLEFADFSSAGVTNSWENSMEWGASVDVWGSGMSYSGHYSKGVINTQKTETATGLNMSAHLGGLDMTIGEVGYIVVPYSYWATNGALVIDYAVRPELSPGGGTPTWWQVRYGSKSDPTFILPWRLDPERGFRLEEQEKRRQTKDILITPTNAERGDPVTIRAIVHNFSLVPTPQPIGVRFYLGDPDSGGTLITAPGGTSVVYTNLALPARGMDTVQLPWVLPAHLSAFQRIYAVIDQGNAIDEIHETNNIGWTILALPGSTGIATDPGDALPTRAGLDQNYPNPFNPSTTFRYQVPLAGMVRIAVFDLLGREVSRLVDGYNPAGEFIARFDGSRYASGMYICRMEYGGMQLQRKIMLVK